MDKLPFRLRTAEFNFNYSEQPQISFIEDGISVDDEGDRFSIGSNDIAETGQLSTQVFLFTEASTRPTHLLSQINVDSAVGPPEQPSS